MLISPLLFPFLPVAALAISAGSALFGAIQNNNARRAQQKLLDQQKAEYEKEMKTPYVETAEAQAVLHNAKENMQEQSLRQENRAAMTGATHEAKLAARETANKGYANIVRQVAAGANNYRNNLRNWYRGIIGQQNNLYEMQAQSGNNMVQSGLASAMAAAGNLATDTTGAPPATATAAATANASPLNELLVDSDIVTVPNTPSFNIT